MARPIDRTAKKFDEGQCGLCQIDPDLFQSRFYGQRQGPVNSTEPLTEASLNWAAGFLEGEGTFGSGWKRKTVRTSARQVNTEPLLKLQRIFGGTVTYIAAPSQVNVKISEWRCSGNRARAVMRAIYPLMSNRRKRQIQKAFAANYMEVNFSDALK